MARKLAIVEKLTGHTELMGGFVSLGFELGYETHLFYNTDDRFQMAEYFRNSMPHAVRSIRAWGDILNDWPQFDAIILTTSDVWRDFVPLLARWASERRLIVVHHRPDYIALMPEVTGYIALTPVFGHDRWIFPLYSKTLSLSSFANGRTRAGLADLPTMVTIGSLRTKDNSAVGQYLRVGGHVIHYGRDGHNQYEAYGNRFQQHTALSGIALIDSLNALPDPVFLWCPVAVESEFTALIFTSSLIVGFHLNCTMVMPEKLRLLYGFPSNGVITYCDCIFE
jgi:hypothetical protein